MQSNNPLRRKQASFPVSQKLQATATTLHTVGSARNTLFLYFVAGPADYFPTDAQGNCYQEGGVSLP